MAIEFIAMIGLELDMIEKIIEPQDDMQPGEEVQGEISEELRKLYTVWKQAGRSAGALENELRWGAAKYDSFPAVQEMKAKASVINMIFWIAVQDELHLWEKKEGLALRKGWKVVTCPVPPGFPSFFKFLGGGE